MAVEIRYRYDENFARRAAKRFLLRYSRMKWFALLLLVIAILAAISRMEYLYILFVAVAIAWVVMIVRYPRRAAALARAIGSPEITIRADDDGLAFHMPSYESKSAWAPTREIWLFDDVWIFFAFGSASFAYTAVPTAAMTPEFREIVTSNMRKHGAKMR